jgi:ubiquinone/menaquinone biosynthesis C-methylase UbiE
MTESGERAQEFSASYARWRASRLGRITDGLEQQTLLEMLGSLDGQRVLDVGCGDGAFSLTLARRGAEITGLDRDPVMIAAARRRAEIEKTPAQFVQGTVASLPFPGATFDRVLAVTVLCFVDDVAPAIAEMARVLRPGGRLVIGELGRWSVWAATRRLRGWLGSETWTRARFRSVYALRTLANNAGLAVTDLRGAVFYPPIGWVATVCAPFDNWLGGRMTFGAAFLVLAATKLPRK